MIPSVIDDRGRIHPVLLLLSGNLVGAAVGGAFFLSASWRLSLEDMGRYAVAISVQWVAFGLIGTGLGIATLRVVRDRLAAGDRPAASGVVLFAAIGVGSTAIILAAIVHAVLDRAAMPIAPVVGALAVLWAGARALLECTRSGLLAQQNFSFSALLSAVSGATGLSALALVLMQGDLQLHRLLAAHLLGLFSAAVAGAVLLAPLARHGVRLAGARDLFGYARWPALSEGTRLLQVNLGPLFLVALAGAGQAGLFGMARYPAYLFDVIAVTLYQYWLARAVNVDGAARLRKYVSRQLRFAGMLGVVMVVAAIAAQPLFPRLGGNFSSVGLLFVLCSLDFALVLLVRPIESAYHGLARPRLELVQRCVTLPVLVASALVLASRWGAHGMVSAHIIASLVSLGTGAVLLRGALRDQAPRPLSPAPDRA